MPIKYIKNTLLSLTLMLSLTACGGEEDNTPPTDVIIESGTLDLDVNGVSRNLNYRVPTLSSYPLVIALHGGGDSIESFEGYAGITPLVNRDKDFGVVYPKGAGENWNDGRSETGTTADDVAFIQAVIDTYKTKGANKFYLIGMSNGGVMAQRLACELADQIEGFAVVAATQSSYLQTNCMDTTTPLQTMFLFGDDDRSFLDNLDIIVPGFPNQKRGTHIGINPTINYWLSRNGCLSSLHDVQSINAINDDNTQVNLKEGTNCNKQTLYYQIAGGGHRWPDPSGSNDIITTGFLGHASHEISTAQEMINFFKL